MSTLTFQEAIAQSQTFSQKPNTEELLQLYGLYKQATEGDPHGERPGGFDFKRIAKYQAWDTYRGLSKQSAEKKYSELVTSLLKKYA